MYYYSLKLNGDLVVQFLDSLHLLYYNLPISLNQKGPLVSLIIKLILKNLFG